MGKKARVGATCTAHGRGTSTFPALFFDGTTHDTNIMLAGVDKGFLAEQRARAEQRAARFAREAQQGPPLLGLLLSLSRRLSGPQRA